MYLECQTPLDLTSGQKDLCFATGLFQRYVNLLLNWDHPIIPFLFSFFTVRLVAVTFFLQFSCSFLHKISSDSFTCCETLERKCVTLKRKARCKCLKLAIKGSQKLVSRGEQPAYDWLLCSTVQKLCSRPEICPASTQQPA